MKDEEIRQAVRDAYAQVARKKAEGETDCCASQGCCSSTEAASAPVEITGCCDSQVSGSKLSRLAEEAGLKAGYSAEELGAIPDGADMGLGCGNPTALASLKEGEVVVDLGSGGGVDCFLAAGKVGRSGSVIGVDMTPEMLSNARANHSKGGYENVDFRLGEIEHLPLADNSADAVISNCVINLSPDKPRVFREVYRILKPGGRLMVSDIVLLADLPQQVRESMTAYTCCIAGALPVDEYLAAIEAAGFENIENLNGASIGTGELKGTILSANVRAFKPQ